MMHPEWQGEDVGTKGRMKVVRDAGHAERVKAMRANYRVTYRTLWDHAGTTFERADGVRYATCHPTNATLAEWVGVDCRTVSRHLAALAEAGVIVVVGEGRARVICLFEDPDNLDKTAHKPRQIDTQTTTKRDTNLDNLDHEPRQKNHEPRQVAPPYKEEQTEQTLTRPNQREDAHARDAIGKQCAMVAEVYRATPGMHGHEREFREACVRLVTAGTVEDMRTAADMLVRRARDHADWLTANHPDGAGYTRDGSVRRLKSWLRDGCYAKDAAEVFAHVKPLPRHTRPDVVKVHEEKNHEYDQSWLDAI